MTVTVDEEKLEEGLFVLPSDQRWRKLDFSGKEVMEFETMVEEEGQQVKVTVALLVNSISEDENGELMAYGRFVGCDREEVSKAFSNDINRKNLPIHMCQKDPCDGLHLIVGAHVLRARWFQVGNFAAAYMKTWGMMVLKEAENGPAGGKPKASPKRRAPPGRQPFKPRQDSKKSWVNPKKNFTKDTWRRSQGKEESRRRGQRNRRCHSGRVAREAECSEGQTASEQRVAREQRRKRKRWQREKWKAERQRSRWWMEPIWRLEQEQLVERSAGEQRLQGQQDREGWEEGEMRYEPSRMTERLGHWKGGFNDLLAVAEVGHCLKKIGCILAWHHCV